MNVKDNKKQNEKKLSEIKPGTLFKYGDLYFIRTSDTVYFRFCDWYQPIEAICVSDGKPRSFRYCELVEVFPDAFISVRDE